MPPRSIRRKPFGREGEKSVHKTILDSPEKLTRKVYDDEGGAVTVRLKHYDINPDPDVHKFLLLENSGPMKRPVIPTGQEGNEYLEKEIIRLIANDFSDTDVKKNATEIQVLVYLHLSEHYYFFDDRERTDHLVQACLSDALAVRTRHLEAQVHGLNLRHGALAIKATLDDAKDDLEIANETLTQQAVATDSWQGRFEELAELAQAGAVDGQTIAEIRSRSLLGSEK